MKNVKYPCRGCIYNSECGDNTRTMPCEGRMTKREKKAFDRKNSVTKKQGGKQWINT